MRILLLSFVLALPLASVASANENNATTSSSSHGNLGRRTIGLGIGQDMAYVGLGDGASLVDETSLRWQPSGRIALEPNVRFGASRLASAPTNVSNSQSVRLGSRLRVTAMSRGAMHLVGLMGVSGGVSRERFESDANDLDQTLTSTYGNANAGFGVEYAPKRWWSLGVDYRLALAGFSRTTFDGTNDQEPNTQWSVGPSNGGRIVATGHVYF